MTPDDLSQLFEDKGPFLTVYLPAPDAGPDQQERHRLRWEQARRQLEGAGADQPILDALDAAVLEEVPDPGSTLAVIAGADGGVRLRAVLPDTELELVDAGSVPRLVPLLEWRRDHPPALVVIADHAGADIWEISGARLSPAGHIYEHAGPEMERTQPGGWSQRRFQQRAENFWADNAREAAAAVEELSRTVRPRLIAVAGEPHSLHYLDEHLATNLRPLVHRLEHGSRAPGSDLERILEEASRAIATVAAGDVVEVLDRYAEERGQHDRAADGPAATFEALSRHQVATLLVHDDPGDDRTAFAADDGRQVALEPGPLRDLGMEPQEGRLVDVAVRAALLTGADVAPVPAHGPNTPSDHLGALLRFTDSPS